MVPIETLETLSFFEGFPPEYLKPLASVARLVEVPAGEVLFEEGHKSANIYVVVEGKVALEVWLAPRGAIQIQTVGPGKLLGWSPVLAQGAMTATARSLQPSRLVAINAMQVLEACGENPHLGAEFMRRTALALARRLSATRRHLLEAYGEEFLLISE